MYPFACHLHHPFSHLFSGYSVPTFETRLSNSFTVISLLVNVVGSPTIPGISIAIWTVRLSMAKGEANLYSGLLVKIKALERLPYHCQWRSPSAAMMIQSILVRHKLFHNPYIGRFRDIQQKPISSVNLHEINFVQSVELLRGSAMRLPR
jgi:hypothetical protein